MFACITMLGCVQSSPHANPRIRMPATERIEPLYALAVSHDVKVCAYAFYQSPRNGLSM